MNRAVVRSLEGRLRAAVEDSPAIMILGPRQAGKSTLAGTLLDRDNYEVLSLDNVATRARAANDPDGFIAQMDGSAIIDEVQRVPELFGPIKAAIDRDRRPGRFVLTGSANYLLLPQVADSLAGRIELLRLMPFSQSELAGTDGLFIERCFASSFRPTGGLSEIDRRSLIELLLRGGFPPVQRRDPERRSDWFADYVTTIFERDLREIGDIEKTELMPGLLAELAARTRSHLNVSAVASSLGVSENTIKRYLLLLERLFITQRVSAYTRKATLRTTKAPRMLLCDTGLLAYVLEIDSERLRRNETLLGHLLEHFVGTELLKQAEWNRPRVIVQYLRVSRGEEVDFLLTRRSGEVVGIEVKAADTVRSEDFRHLRKLKQRLAERMVCGFVIHTGSEVGTFEDGLYALPVTALWQ